MVNANRVKAGIGVGGSCCGGFVEGNILSMCNKTCSVPLSHLGSAILVSKASSRSAGFIPSKKGSLQTPSIIRHLDIRTMFSPFVWSYTPHKLATEQVMEDKMAVQAKVGVGASSLGEVCHGYKQQFFDGKGEGGLLGC